MSVLSAAALGAALLFSPLSQADSLPSAPWTGTWGITPSGLAPPNVPLAIANQTIRLVIHTSIGGKRVRIRLSNEMGATPLRIGAAHIAIRAGGASIAPGSDRVLTFSGQPGIVIPPGAPVVSDPVELNVAALSDLAVSVYFPDTATGTTFHRTKLQTQYMSESGDFTGAATLPVKDTFQTLPFLTAVDVDAPGAAAIVTLGDSITDGLKGTLDTNHRWPDWLARRLQGAPGKGGRLGVVNRGLSGNRLLTDTPPDWATGRSVLERFDRDVLATSGARYLIVMIGINDIGTSTPEEPVTAAGLIAGYRQVVARAHAKGLTVYGATLTPFEGADYYSPEGEQVRQAANAWIRASGNFDAVIDFDRVLRDPANPGRMLGKYDSSDHLHPSDAGYQAMGNAVPLGLFGVH